MKEKRTYSLTARERKQRRNAAQNKSNRAEKPESDKQNVSLNESEERAMVVAQKKSKRSAIIIGAIACVAIVLIIVALIAPVIAYLVNPYRDYDYVIARFDLSNEMVLEYVVEEDQYDIAATNFIFLAKNGYFDNTVFFDAGDKELGTDGWMRFGGYEDQPSVWEGGSSQYASTHHHAQNKDYCSAFSAIPNDRFTKNVCDKFGYDLYPDSGANIGSNGENPERLNDIGVLAYLYDNTSTEFQMSYKADASNDVTVITNGNISTDELKCTMVGYALNDKTIENLQAIAATATVNTAISTGVRWCPPSPTIRIERVKIYNLDGAKWNNFDFMDYMTTKNENGLRLKSWTGRS